MEQFTKRVDRQYNGQDTAATRRRHTEACKSRIALETFEDSQTRIPAAR